MNMNHRIRLANFLIRLSHFIHSLPIVIMKPDDMIEFSRRKYSRPQSVDCYSTPEIADSGLYPDELSILQKVPVKQGNMLILGMGGGREAIPLARMGFDVTGVDCVKESVEKSIQNANRHGLKIKGIVGDMARLKLPDNNTYDIAWMFTTSLYSCVPTRQRRVLMLRNLWNALKPDGIFVCQFQWADKKTLPKHGEHIKRLLALTGNRNYEHGDILFGDLEYRHVFSSRKKLESEFRDGGFEVGHMEISEKMNRGGAVLRKSV